MSKKWSFSFTDDMIDMGLRGNEVLIYSIILGYTNGKIGYYFGSRKRLADMIGISESAAIRVLKRLVEQGMIEKTLPEKNGIDTCQYRAVVGGGEIDRGGETKGCQKATRGGSEKPPIPLNINNKLINKETIIIEKKVGENPAASEVSDTLFPPDPEKEKVAPKEKAPRRFVKPTIEQIQAYCDEHKININAKDFWYYYESVGWVVGKNRKPMKSWQASIYTWVRNDKLYSKSQASQPAARKSSINNELNLNPNKYYEDYKVPDEVQKEIERYYEKYGNNQ